MTPSCPGSLHVDVGAVFHDRFAPRLPNLVTRPTGRAVRAAIERRCSGPLPESFVSLIDLSRVQVLDFSCADEVVARLLIRYLRSDRPRNAFFVFRAVCEIHRHAVEAALARHSLAMVCDFGDGRFHLTGMASDEERAIWEILEERRAIGPNAWAEPRGERGAALLVGLAERRLALRQNDGTLLALSAVAQKNLPDSAVARS